MFIIKRLEHSLDTKGLECHLTSFEVDFIAVENLACQRV